MKFYVRLGTGGNTKWCRSMLELIKPKTVVAQQRVLYGCWCYEVNRLKSGGKD